MNELFLKIINMTISASWLILVVLILRLALEKAPKWVNVLLWGIVAVRLMLPFSIESALSLIPSAETIPVNIEMDTTPAIDSGIHTIDRIVNPMISQSNTTAIGESINPLQIMITIFANIWVLGAIALLLYTAISCWHLHKKIGTAVILRDGIFQSENVRSPFVLGIVRPKIYLPYRIDDQNLNYVVAHELAHIRRGDHWWKPVGFLLLIIHWFNPLIWLAYLLLCRDIELACDEKVIKELGNEQRADYTQALLSCSINRRTIAACPLAFGEIGVKERVKSVMKYKKPTFQIIVSAVIACTVVAVCFLTNPTGNRKFTMKGDHVSELEPQQIIEEIAGIERLDDSSLLYVNANNYDLLLTPDFDWAHSGTISFFYMENQKTYGAQLRLFIEDKQYSVTKRAERTEVNQVFKLQDYLEALKYMPQEQIRQMSPDADRYLISLTNYGTPDNFERAISYTSSNVCNIENCCIHLVVLPLHEAKKAYEGTTEAIHLFYGHGNSA